MRWRRKLKRLLLGLVGLAALIVVLVLLALANLDARPMKGWVRGAAQAQGIALDYEAGKLTLGGLRFARIRIASPAADAALAPDLIAIGSIDGRWSPLSRRLDELVIRDVVVTVVRDPDGTTSLDRWLAQLPASPPKAEPSDPLSALGRALAPPGGLEAHARIEGVTIAVIDRGGGATPRRLSLTGLTAKADLAGGGLALALGPGALRLAIEPGTAAEAGAARELVLDLRGEAKLPAGGQTAALSLDATVQRQTLAPQLPAIKELVSLAATVEFDPAHKRTRLGLEHLRLLDGAAALTTAVRVEDVGTAAAPGMRPVVEQLALRVDLAAIARAVPPALGPVEVEGAPFVVTLKDAAAAPSPQGALAASGTLVRARWRDVAIRGLVLGVDAKPEGGDGARGELRLAVAELTTPDLTVREVDATIGAEHPAMAAAAPPPTTPTATVAPPAGAGLALWPLRVTARATVGSVETPTQRVQAIALAARATLRSPAALDADLTLDVAALDAGAAVRGVHVEAADTDVALGALPLAAAGAVHLEGTVASAQTPAGLRARTVVFTADARLGTAPVHAKVALDAGQLVVPGLAAKLGPAFAGGPMHAELALPALDLVATDPAKSRAAATILARYGGATVDGTANGSLDEIAYTLQLKAPRIGPARELVVSSKGTVRPPDTRISHDTQISVGPTATATGSLRGARIHLVSSGTPRQHDATIAVAVDAPSSGGRTFPSVAFDVAAKADLVRGAVDLRLTGKQPAADLRVIAALDAARAIHWQATGKVAGLGAAAVVLPPGPDWSRLAVDVDGRGVASGIVASVAGGVPVLVANPATALRGHEALTLTVRDVHYADPALTRADVDAATLKAELELGKTRTAVVTLDVPQLAAVTSGVKLGAKALAVRLDATLGAHGVARGVDARLTVKAASATQSAAPWYAISEPVLEVTVGGDPDATLAVAIHLANPGGGTAFDVKGDVERGQTTPAAGVVARNSLALEGTLVQGLDRLDAVQGQLAARGTVRVPFRVESGDLSLFRTTAQIALERVSVELPASKLRVTEINGQVPVVQEFVLGPAGVARVGQGERGPFSQLRFPDYRPFAGDADYLTIGEIVMNGSAFGPAAGNARIDHDIVSLDQLELSALGGKITGQLLAQLRGADTELVFRGKLTGLRAPAPGAGGQGSRDPFDANVALALTPYRLGLEGRAEIVRIGRDHLRALLDAWDPYHADVAANRVRLALLAGYPKQVRLGFASGFASLAIELGGLAGVVRIDELRGLPIGPALAHYLAPILEP